MHYGLMALMVGFFAAVSLPAGAFIGLQFRPGTRVNSALMAFGAGAILFALTVEIVAHRFHEAGYWPLAAGCLAGGLLYELFNRALDRMGAFLRKTSSAIYKIARMESKRAGTALRLLATIPLFHSLTPKEIARLARFAKEETYEDRAGIFTEGDLCDALYVIIDGEVEVSKQGEVVARGRKGEIFGEMGILTGERRVVSAAACGPVKLLRIAAEAFGEAVEASSGLRRSLEKLLLERSAILEKDRPVAPQTAVQWRRQALAALRSHDFSPSKEDVKKTVSRYSSAGNGIWLGNLLDAVPESLVIGLAVSGQGAFPWPFIAGVFLANFPEAMSASVLMAHQGFSKARISLMWWSVAAVAGLCAFLGNVFLQNLSITGVVVLEGMTAGALLVMVSETMLPEAFEEGGTVVGLSTLAGFLAVLLVKSLF